MSEVVYILGFIVCFACSALLLRGYRRSRQALLLWSGLCFVGLGISNVLVFLDAILPPQMDLYPARLLSAVVSMSLLVYGLIWEAE